MGPDFLFGRLVERGAIVQGREQKRKSKSVWGRKVMSSVWDPLLWSG